MPRRGALAGAISLCLLIGPAAQRCPAQPAATAPAPAAGPTSPFDGAAIRSLIIVGLDVIPESYVRNQIRSRVAQPYTEEALQQDVGRLLRTGRFIDVDARRDLVDGMVEITLTVTEKPEVASLEFRGNNSIKDKDLREGLNFGAGDPLDTFDVRRGRESIERLYREKGYAYAEVTVDETLLEQRQVVYVIVENQRVRVKKVTFEGNEYFPERELKGVVETKSYIWIFRTGDFDPDRADRDAAAVQKYYRDRGFLDAEVAYAAEFTDVAREWMQVVFRVSEGIRYTIREIRFEGNEVYPDESLLAIMQLHTGEYIVASRLERDRKAIEDLYGSNGYIEANIAAGWVYAEQEAEVVVNVSIEEGGQFTVGYIEVHGHAFTQEKTVRRELRFYPGDIYDVTRTRKAETDLRSTELFTEATIVPTGSDPDVRQVLVNVKESDKTQQFIAGVGASSNDGLVGQFVLENKNFDLFDRPRSWGEFFRGRAYRGAGQTLRLQLEPGTELTRFRIDFREPYLLDLPIGFGTGVYIFDRGRDGYDERRYGGYFSFDKKFEEGLLKTWTGEVAFRAEYVDVRDVDSFAAEDIRDVEGGSYLSSVKFSLLHDNTDSRMLPTRGHRFQTSWEQAGAMGGDYTFAKLNSAYTHYWTVAIDEKDRPSVVAVRGSAGQILGDAPVFERFYAGGIGSFRGFDFRGISPRDGLRNNRVGGDFSLLTGAEYSFPLVAKAVRGVFFTDMGTVEEDFGITSWRASVGAGVRLTLDIFGTVPMEFDLALPVAKDSEDDDRIFSFFIGLPFL